MHSFDSNKAISLFRVSLNLFKLYCIFADSACAVNPFIKNFSDESLKKEFLEQLVKEIGSLNQNISFKKDAEDQQEYISLPYYLLVAYVQKPSA